MISTYARGNKIIFIDGIWKYKDGTVFDDSRPCVLCKQNATSEGYDACLGYIEGVKSACCGHGINEGFVVYKD